MTFFTADPFAVAANLRARVISGARKRIAAVGVSQEPKKVRDFRSRGSRYPRDYYCFLIYFHGFTSTYEGGHISSCAEKESRDI
jgi:hypothetical protein